MNLVSLDNQIFSAIYSFAGRNVFLDWFGIFCARYLIWAMAVLFFIWWLDINRTRPSQNWPVFGRRKWLEIGSIILSVIWAVVLNQLLSLTHFRPRPFVLGDVENLITTFSVKSFPSDHATVVFALAMAVFFYSRKMGIILFFMAFFVGIGRIYVGVHYPADIMAGALIGLLAAFAIRWIFLKTMLRK